MNDQMKALLPRIAMGLGVFIVGALVGWFVRGSGGDGAASIRVYDDWRVVCPADKTTKVSCQLTSELVDPKSGVLLARLAIGNEDGKETLAVRVPLTVLIPAGVGVQFGSETQTFQYATCAAEGCLAFVPMDDKLRSSFDGAKSLSVLVTASQNGKSVALPMSVKGFADAEKAYKNSEARRNSWWRKL